MSVFHKVNRSGKSKVLSPEERSLIQSCLPEKYRLISEVLYWSAGRIQEVLSIRVRNLVPERGMVVLERKTTKTKETREVYLPEHLMDRLVSRATALGLEPSEPLFFNQSPTESGQPIRRPLSTQSFDKELRKVCDWNRLSGISSQSFRFVIPSSLGVEQVQMSVEGHLVSLGLCTFLENSHTQTIREIRYL